MSVIAAEGKLLGGYSAGLGKRLVRKNAMDRRKHFASINFFGPSSSPQPMAHLLILCSGSNVRGTINLILVKNTFNSFSSL